MVDRAIIGGQFGDEGKGKIVDYLNSLMLKNSLEQHWVQHPQIMPNLVKRYQGSANAGHSLNVMIDQILKSLALHQVPSGILNQETYNLIGEGMLFNGYVFRKEKAKLESAEVQLTSDNFGISSKAIVVPHYHILADQKNKTRGSKNSTHISTGNGVRQTAADLMSHNDLRVAELSDEAVIKEVLARKHAEEQEFLRSRNLGPIKQWLMRTKNNPHFKPGTLEYHALVKDFLKMGEELAPYIVSLPQANKQGLLNRLFEGAQSVGLDVIYGLHSGTTSSSPVLIPSNDANVFGVFKAYQSSVGHGDRGFVGQMEEDLESTCREAWAEYGTTTKLPRSVGWFDTVLANYTIEAGQMNHITLTCLDKLEYLHEIGEEEIKVVTGYKTKNGQVLTEWTQELDNRIRRREVTPVYESVPTFAQAVDENGELTAGAKRYVEFLEDKLNKKFSIVSYGKEREETMIRDQYLMAA